MSASMAEVLRELLEEVWDDGNAMGLDGWIGPGRGAGEVDSEAVRGRERVIQKAEAALAANGYGKLEEGCDRTANVPLEGFEFLPTCLGCGETLVHDYYHGELAYRHKEA